jgi:tRNA dimethylallyltransferase
MRRTAHFLVGPTASGKSAVAHLLAEQMGARMVSADSMNIYEGMDIGTAKPAAVERGRVDYFGVDVVLPTSCFSVAAYLNCVAPAFDGERPVIVSGGTGLYVKCLIEGLDEAPSENRMLRAELESLPIELLIERVRQDAPDFYGQLTDDDRLNPRRLVRVLERKAAGQSLVQSPSWGAGEPPRVTGLRVDRTVLCDRIEARVRRMYADGLLAEAARLIEQPLSKTALQAIGYAEAFAVLRGRCSESEAQERTIIRTRQLAKRQMTWFRNQLNVEWVDVAADDSVENLAQRVLAVWNRIGWVKVRI